MGSHVLVPSRSSRNFQVLVVTTTLDVFLRCCSAFDEIVDKSRHVGVAIVLDRYDLAAANELDVLFRLKLFLRELG
jgi:hypothetical protein